MLLQCGNLSPIEYFFSSFLHITLPIVDNCLYPRLYNLCGTLVTGNSGCVECCLSEVCVISKGAHYCIGLGTTYCKGYELYLKYILHNLLFTITLSLYTSTSIIEITIVANTDGTSWLMVDKTGTNPVLYNVKMKLYTDYRLYIYAPDTACYLLLYVYLFLKRTARCGQKCKCHEVVIFWEIYISSSLRTL